MVAFSVSASSTSLPRYLLVAVLLVDVVGGLLRAHPLQRRPAPGADGRHGGAPGASTEDDDVGLALRTGFQIRLFPLRPMPFVARVRHVADATGAVLPPKGQLCLPPRGLSHEAPRRTPTGQTGTAECVISLTCH